MTNQTQRGSIRGRARGRVMIAPGDLPYQMSAHQFEVDDLPLSSSASTMSEAVGSDFDPGDSASMVAAPVGSSSIASSSASIMTRGSVASSLVNETGRVGGQVARLGTSEEPSKGIRQTIKDGFNKVGTSGEKMSVMSNYLHINQTPNFQLQQYRVDFQPEEDDTYKKKRLMRSQEEVIGSYIFDGHMLYITSSIPMEKRELIVRGTDGEVAFKIFIKYIGCVNPDSPMYLQFYNMVMRKCMQLLKFEELGRHFYNPHAAIRLPEEKLELWPGIVTAIRNHQVGTLLCVEITHKVLRMSPVLDIILDIKARNRSNMEAYKEAVKKELVGTIVMTHYNRKTYKVDDVDFSTSPSSTFEKDGNEKKYADYYLERYKVRIENLDQPMLVSFPKKRDINKGETGNILLVPALCNPTGLTDDMRKNFTLMKKLSDNLHMGPSKRKIKLDEFVRTLRNNADVQKEFQQWNIDFHPRYLLASARQHPRENIFMGPEGSEPTDGGHEADWTRKLRGRGMLFQKEFKKWILFVPQMDNKLVDQFLDTLKSEARKLAVNCGPPIATVVYADGRRLAATIRAELGKRGAQVEFAMIILQNNNLKTYTEVKRTCILDFSIGCQCFLSKNMNKSDPKARQKLGSICVKVMIQITAKLGGVPWAVKIPVKRLMVLGFDVYHCSERKGESVGALVSTTDQTLTRYHSMVGFHKDKSELAHNLTATMLKSLQAYVIENGGALPDRVILFRDGVGEGQINYVLDYEIPRLRKAIQDMYAEREQEMAKLAVVIVTKKINSRIMLERSEQDRVTYSNVGPGTVVDNTFTLPERYDFFLVSQSVNQGTVSPTNYNVVIDDSGFTPDHMQKLSFKLCHLYYNWCGTVAVPAPCQYAHKLAYLTGVALNDEAPKELANNLWYL